MATNDLVQIGISEIGRTATSILLGEVELRPGVSVSMFSSARACYKFAVAVAIKNNLDPIEDASFRTSQDAERLDSDHRMRTLVGYAYPNRPDKFRLSQGLAEAGFRFILDCLERSESFDEIAGLS
jgi:hypothetical protein